jgi:hypothetical protein
VPYLVIYGLGVVVGLAVMRDRWPARIVTSLAWPLGPVAFLVVAATLLVAAAMLWPVPVLGGAAALAGVIWFLS